VRKSGKLPGETVKASFIKEYGEDQFEVQVGSIEAGQRVIVIDDLLATGGSMAAACSVIQKLEGNILEALVIIELADLKGSSKVPAKVKAFLSYSD